MDNHEFENTNASDLWTKSILGSLQRIEDYELISRQGCENLIEYAGIQLNSRSEFLLAEVQLKNLDFMITEMDVLFAKIRPRTSKTFNENLEKNLKTIKTTFSNPEVRFIKRSKNRAGARISNLQEPFYKILEIVLSLRSQIIQELAPLLFVEKEERMGANKLK